MGSDGSFEESDRSAATNFGQAAKDAGVRRIIYLGGLGSDEEGLSPHLRSRHQVGRILRESGVPVLEFRASVVIGSGSLSFEMIRSLVERLPIMITPKWVRVMAQPIAINDLLEYLLAALRLPSLSPLSTRSVGRTRYPTRTSCTEYARQQGCDVYAFSARTHALSIQPVAGASHTTVHTRRTQAHRKHHSPHGSPRRRRARDVRR